MELKERIKKARKMRRYKSQEKLAEFLGTTRNAITEYEMGRVIPSDVFLQLMAAKLNLSYEWLKEGKGEMEARPSNIDAIIESLDVDDVEIVRIYAELPLEHKRILKDFAAKIAAAKTKPAPPAEEPKAPPLPEEEFSLSPLPIPTPEDYLAYERVRNFYRRRRPDHTTTYEERRAMVEAEMEAERKAAETSAASTLGGSTA